jgi:hypothetical protein
MKTLKVFCAATVLALSLSIPAYADGTNPGEIHDPGKALCVLELTGGDSVSTDLTTVDSDLSLMAIVDMVWTVSSIF